MYEFKFLTHQLRGMESIKNEVILSGAYGSGKSAWLCAKIVFLLTRYPKNRGFLCRKTLQALKSTTLKTLLDGDGDMPPLLPSHLIKNHNKQDRLITLINGSELYYGNMDIDFIKSMNLGFAAVDELTELTEDEWNALGGRLRLSGVPIHQLLGSTNPSTQNHWLYNRAMVNQPKDEFGNVTIDFFTSSTLDNHYLPKSYVQNLKRILFGSYYERYVLGKWVGAGTNVYDNFEPKIHLIKNFDPPKHWKRYRAVDFGYRAPFFCGWFVKVGDDAKEYNEILEPGDIILYRELYYTERTTTINAKQVTKFSVYPDGSSEKFITTVCDWDAGDRADLEAEGIRTIQANKDITIGIQKVRERLGNNDPTRGLVVRSSFYIFEQTLTEYDPKIQLDLDTGSKNNNPTRAADEFMVYGWKPNQKGKIKEEPEDINNHAMDPIRYFICYMDGTAQWRDIEFKSL